MPEINVSDRLYEYIMRLSLIGRISTEAAADVLLHYYIPSIKNIYTRHLVEHRKYPPNSFDWNISVYHVSHLTDHNLLYAERFCIDPWIIFFIQDGRYYMERHPHRTNATYRSNEITKYGGQVIAIEYEDFNKALQDAGIIPAPKAQKKRI